VSPELHLIPQLRIGGSIGRTPLPLLTRVYHFHQRKPFTRMSSGFVSAGTNEEPVERDDEWRKAQETVEANFRRKQEEGKQDGAKSLYDVLQQNKGDLPVYEIYQTLRCAS
jgi:hypothetical protein